MMIKPFVSHLLLLLIVLYSVHVSGQQDTALVTRRNDTTAKELKLITIRSARKTVEMKNGKLIYHVESSAAAAGSNAFDLLRRTPGIKIDQNENLLLKGSAAANVMVDGKMTYLSGQQLANLLKGMMADQISKIEVITAPSSQFEASGNAGIINVVTRKSNKLGYAANISAGATLGRYLLNNESINGNVKTSGFNFFGNLGYNYRRSYQDQRSTQIVRVNGEDRMIERIGNDPIRTNYYNYRAGVDWYLTRKQQLGLVYTGFTDKWIKDAGGTTYIRNGRGALDAVLQNRNYANEPYDNHAYNLNYKYDIDSSGTSLTADADYISYRNHSDGYLGTFTQTIADATPDTYFQLNFHQPNQIYIRSVKTDLIYPAGKVNLKAGLKYSSTKIDNNFRYDSLQNNLPTYAPSLSDHFVYKEEIAAAYLSAGRQWRNTTVDAGLRVEHTYSLGNSIHTNTSNKRTYTDLFPSLAVTQQFGANHKLDFSMSRRINRPGYTSLNPARYFSDQFAYYQGNVNLIAEKAWIAAVGYTLMDRYIASISFNRTSNFISSSVNIDPENGTLIRSIANFEHRDRFEAQVIVPFELSDFWSVNANATLSYTQYPLVQLNGFKTVSRTAVDLYAGQTFKLPLKITMEVLTRYTSPELNGVYLARYYFSMDGGLKKTFLKDKLDARFAFADLFHTGWYWGYSLSNTANFTYKNTPDSNRFSINLIYHLGGKLSGSKPRQIDEQKRL